MNEEHSIRAIPSALQQAGIEDRQFGGGFLQITETTGLAIARLRSFPEVQETSSREILLPEITGQAITGDPSVLCLRPGEWLFTSESMGGEQLHEHVRSRSNPAHGCVYDFSDGLAVLRISGEGAPWLLSKVSGLDYLAGRSRGDHCTRTRMAQVAVVVHFHSIPGDQRVFDLIFDRSLARYLWELLTQSTPHAQDLSDAFGAAS